MYQIIDNFDPNGYFEGVVFSTLDKAREYATKLYGEVEGLFTTEDEQGDFENLEHMEECGEVSFVFLTIDPE